MKNFAQTLLDNLATSVLVLSQELTILYANPATEQLFGIGSRRLQEQNINHFVKFSSLNFSLLQKELAKGQSLSDSDVTLIIESRPLQLELSATPIQWQAKNAILLELKSINKIQEINQDWYQQIQQQTARKLIRNLAHEIKNPLGGLRGAAQLLEQELEPKLKEYTNMIIEQADRLKNLVDRLLGPQKLSERKAHNIHSILEKARQLTELANPKLKFTRDYDPSLPEWNMDSEQIEQAILNILNNAADILSNQDNGCITLRTRTKFQVVINGKKHRLAAKIDIIDNGAGIDEKLKETLFYPTISGRADGSGLGLAISRELIHRHQGKINAKSWPGKTTFSILLPIL